MLDSIKADVRATVFTALNKQLSAAGTPEKKQRGGAGARASAAVGDVLSSEGGREALALAVDLLQWCGLKQTLKVLECELPPLLADHPAPAATLRDALAEGAGGRGAARPRLMQRLDDVGVAAGSKPPRSPSPRKPSPMKSLPAIHASPVKPSPGSKSPAPAEAAPSPIQGQEVSTGSLYSEITEEIEEVLSYVEEEDDDGMEMEIDAGGHGGHAALHPMDSAATLHAVNSTLSASDHSGELDSDADEIETAAEL